MEIRFHYKYMCIDTGYNKLTLKKPVKDYGLLIYTLSVLFLLLLLNFLFIFNYSSYSEIFIQICKIISCIQALFNDKTNYNRIFTYFYFFNKTNGQT
jgi:hypothetical protein